LRFEDFEAGGEIVIHGRHSPEHGAHDRRSLAPIGIIVRIGVVKGLDGPGTASSERLGSNRKAVTTKIARGNFITPCFLKALDALGVETLRLKD
jgi:hypothetical protein